MLAAPAPLGLGRCGILPPRPATKRPQPAQAAAAAKPKREEPTCSTPPRAPACAEQPVLSDAVRVPTTGPAEAHPAASHNSTATRKRPAPADAEPEQSSPLAAASEPAAQRSTGEDDGEPAAGAAAPKPKAKAKAKAQAQAAATKQSLKRQRASEPPSEGVDGATPAADAGKPVPKKAKGSAAAAAGVKKQPSPQASFESLESMVGATVQVPAKIFAVDVPGMYYNGVVVRVDAQNPGCLVVRFEDDKSKYWFPGPDVRRWLRSMQRRGVPTHPGEHEPGKEEVKVPSVDTAADEFAAEVLTELSGERRPVVSDAAMRGRAAGGGGSDSDAPPAGKRGGGAKGASSRFRPASAAGKGKAKGSQALDLMANTAKAAEPA